MFDQKKVLIDRYGNNLYKLYDIAGEPLSFVSTVDYFKKIRLTDDELEHLNNYILENVNHSFFDFPCQDYDDYIGYDYFEMGYPANYVSCMRYSSLLITEFSDTKVHSFTCPYFEDINSTACWNVDITDIRNFGSYIKFSIHCKDTWFDVFIGLNDYGLLTSFPDMEKSAMLVLYKGHDWIYNKLFELLNDDVYAESVAEAILYLENLINLTSYNYY